MPSYTNMAWPDDPYGTGQLWRKEPPLLAGFAVRWVDSHEKTTPISYAVAYLRLHRTQTIDLTLGVSFGFRAVSAATEADLGDLVRLFDLDAMRARRLAKIVAGFCLADDLRNMDAFADDETMRGIRGLAAAVDAPDRGRLGLANLFDIAYDSVGFGGDFAVAAANSGIAISTASRAFEAQQALDVMAATAAGLPVGESPLATDRDISYSLEWLAACSTERALISALIAGRALGRHAWEGSLDIGVAMAAYAWDCFSSQDFENQAQSA